MKRTLQHYIILSLLLVVTSCATLSESQREMIHKLSVMGEDVAQGPAAMMEKMAHVRVERGLFYTATLTAADPHIAELEAIAKGEREDLKRAKQFDAGVAFLQSYLNAIASLSNEERWKEYGTQVRSVGRGLAATIEEMNDLQWFEEKVSTKMLKTISSSASLLTESYMKRRQMSLLRDYVQQGDTLVGVCVDSMVVILKGASLKKLMDNEKEGLRDNYRIFLNTLPTTEATYIYDRQYLTLLKEIEEAEAIRKKSITALQAFKRAHAKMATDVMLRKDATEFYEEILDFAAEWAKY
jgi:hypothetical protein